MATLKIIRLGAENIKRLKAVEIVPKGNTVTITGKNDQGKTSILDSIEYALAGKDAICAQPIRQGQAKARIVCDLGDIVVERTFSATTGDSTLRVRTHDGPVKSPQALLDSLCAKIGFDPLEFVRKKPMEQADLLRKLVGLDFSALDARRKKLYEQDRPLKGRELEQEKARLAEYPFDESAPVQEVSSEQLLRDLDGAQKHNRNNADKRAQAQAQAAQVGAANLTIAGMDAEIKRLEDALLDLRVKRDNAATENHQRAITASRCAAECAQLQDVPEGPIRRQWADLENTNAKVRANLRHMEIQTRIEKLQNEYDRLTREIEAIDEQKSGELAFAEFPLPGLGFDDAGVLLNGVPFSQGSQARQLQAAVAIGLALNPKLRVILIRDGSLLDDDSMSLISELAVKHDAQIWVERVDDKSPGAVIIEDGEVKCAT